MVTRPLLWRLASQLLTVLILAAIGFALLRQTGAAGASASAELEGGVITGLAAKLDKQTGASGETAVRFGSSAITCDQAGIQKVVDSVSSASIEANLRKLVQDDSKPTPNELISRHISSPGNKIKTDWARQQLVSYGLQDVSQNFTSGGYQLTNVIGRIPGTTTPNTVYAAGGHIDSTSEKKATHAPGADDNGTGTVAAMEAARVLKPFQPCLKSTLEFIGFNDEEEGMQGSASYANAIKTAKTFKGYINMDMLGTLDGTTACQFNLYSSSSRDLPLAQRLQSVGTKYNIGLPMTNQVNNAHDHDGASFWDANLPSVFATQCGEYDDEHYHSTTDLVQYVNFQQVTKITKSVVGALAELGMQ